MKNLIKILCIACVAFLAACSGGASYSPEKCQALVEKIKSHDQLTESDYNEMIDQFGALVSWMADEKKKAAGDDAVMKEALSSEEGKQKSEYIVYFGLELSEAKENLSASNVARLAKYMKEMNEVKSKD
ncbi:MAG: hypothetical protein HDR80_01575 [Bacteroides sp.]|nr:hypothetical protein [Bacteroides sp.]